MLNHIALMHCTHSLLQRSWGVLGVYTKWQRQKKARAEQVCCFMDIHRLKRYFRVWKLHHHAMKELNKDFKALVIKVILSPQK